MGKLSTNLLTKQVSALNKHFVEFNDQNVSFIPEVAEQQTVIQWLQNLFCGLTV